MDEEYDAIVLGTGLKECIISGLLSSVEKLKVCQVSHGFNMAPIKLCKQRQKSSL